MRIWTYTLTQHEPDEPSRIVSVRRGMKAELDDRADFFEWSNERWPVERYSVELESPEPTGSMINGRFLTDSR